MVVKNTKKIGSVRNVAASMAVENMHLSKEFVSELIQVSNGKKHQSNCARRLLRNMPGRKLTVYKTKNQVIEKLNYL